MSTVATATEDDNLLNGNRPQQPEIVKFQSKANKSIKSRTVLWHVTFWGFVVNYMVRCNINMAIVSMVVPRTPTTNRSDDAKVSECFNHTSVSLSQNISLLKSDDDDAQNGFRIERKIMELFHADYNRNGFEWNEYQQSLILGSFYWMYWITHIPGGFLAKRFGTKLIFGWSKFLSCVTSFLIPITAYLDINALLFLRVLQGFLNLASYAQHNFRVDTTKERSQFVSAYMGASVGLAVCYPIFGFIISTASWEWIFHFCTVAAVIWFICWQYLVYDKPSQHPRIDLDELHYITESLGSSLHNDKHEKIPWMSIQTSVPFWITVVAQWGGVWTLFTLMTQLPTYFKFIHGLDYRMSGFLSGLPHILRMLFSYVLSMFLDYLLRTKKMTRTNVRKIAVFCNCIVCGIATIFLAYVGCDHIMAIVFVSFAMAMLGAQACGPLSSFVDLASNFSSISFGISATVCVLTGTFSSHIVGNLTLNNQTVQQWKYVFLISSGMSLATGIIYILFGSSEEQSWNKSSNEKEIEPSAPLAAEYAETKTDEENERKDCL